MINEKSSIVSSEIYKYPYCGQPVEDEEFLSEKLCLYSIKCRKKLFKKTNKLFICGRLIWALGNSFIPSQAISVAMLP